MYPTHNNPGSNQYAEYTSYFNQVKNALNPDLNVGPSGHNWRTFGDALGMTSRQLDTLELQARGDRFSPTYVQFTSLVIDHYLETHPLKIEQVQTIFARALQNCQYHLYQKFQAIPIVKDSTTSSVTAASQPQQAAQTSSPYMDNIKQILNPGLNVGSSGHDWRAFGDELGMTRRELDTIDLLARGDRFSPNYMQLTNLVIDLYLEKNPHLKESQTKETFARVLKELRRDDLYGGLMGTSASAPSLTSSFATSYSRPSSQVPPTSSFAPVYSRPSPIPSRMEQTSSFNTFTRASYSAETPFVSPISQTPVVAAPAPTPEKRYVRDVLKKDNDYNIFASLNMDNKWKELAHELGYTSEKIAQFELQSRVQGCNFMWYMLSDWTPSNRGTIDALNEALLKLGYGDIAQDLIKLVGPYTPSPAVQKLLDHPPQRAQSHATAPLSQNDAQVSQITLKLVPALSLEGNKDNDFVRDIIKKESHYRIFHPLNSRKGDLWRQVAQALGINQRDQDYAYLAAASGPFPDQDYMRHLLDSWMPTNRATASLLYHVLKQVDEQIGTTMAQEVKKLIIERKGRFVEPKV